MAKAENHDPSAIVIDQQRDESDAQSVFGACRTNAMALINDSSVQHLRVGQMRAPKIPAKLSQIGPAKRQWPT